MTTIEDVARAAGVSTATVSRVINHSATVSEATVEKVQQAIEECHYHANALGRALRANRTKTVLIILSTIVNAFYSKVVKAVEDVADANGYRVVIGTNYDKPNRESDYLGLLQSRLADGVILMRPCVSAAEMESLRARFPIVQCCEYVEHADDVPFVTIDNRAAAYDMMMHLIQTGHRRIALFCAHDTFVSTTQRITGYRDALRDAGIAFDTSLILHGEYGFRNAYAMFNNSYATLQPDAIFALSDRMAAGVIAAAQASGISVPSQLSVAGFDNIDLAHIITPSITTVSQSQYTMGTEAMHKLIAMMQGETNIANTIIQHELKLRDSVRPK